MICFETFTYRSQDPKQSPLLFGSPDVGVRRVFKSELEIFGKLREYEANNHFKNLLWQSRPIIPFSQAQLKINGLNNKKKSIREEGLGTIILRKMNEIHIKLTAFFPNIIIKASLIF